MKSKLSGIALVAVLLLLPVASALACAEMLASTDRCPMEQEGSQPMPVPTKMSCCYVSAAEPAVGLAPVKLAQAATTPIPQGVANPAPEFEPQVQFSLHGLSPGHSSSLQQLFCVFLI